MDANNSDNRGFSKENPATELVFRDGKTTACRSEKYSEDISKTDNIRWKNVLFDFTQASTIHGINHITEDTQFRLRRVIWIILVIAGCCIFALQVVQSVLMYYSRPVTVNVKVNYNDTLVFPAVTICNQNSYRITQSVKHGYYEVLTQAFASQHHKGNDQAGEDHRKDATDEKELHELLKNISMAEVVNKTSHTIEDMVMSCIWDGKPCGPGDIVSKATDHGECLTFNGGNSAIKNATRIGSNGGLRLRLNIEQYEYMSGPIEGAGIKLLIHDQDEIPMVRYLGQAIPPGLHALVGLSILQIGNLKYPYGRCRDDRKLEYYEHYTMSACLLDCRQRHLMKACGCRDVYMTPGPNQNATLPICTLDQYLTCLVKSLNSRKNKCKCPIPCKQMIFNPTITQAALSQFDRQKFLLSNKKLTKQLERNFHSALETRQRVDKDISTSDAEYLRRFCDATLSLQRQLINLRSITASMSKRLNSMFDDWQDSSLFYRWVALSFFEYNIKNNFVRGWTIMQERTLPYVTTDYNGFLASVKLNMDQLESTANVTSQEMVTLRKSIGWEMEKELVLRIEVTKRALDRFPIIYEAFSNGIPAVNYTYTPIAKYNKIYSPLCLGGYEQVARTNANNYLKLKSDLSRMITVLNNIKNSSKNAGEGRPVDKTAMSHQYERFISISKSINYFSFLHKDRVVDKSYKMTEALITNFDQLTTKFVDIKNLIDADFKIVQQSVENFLKNDWTYAKYAMTVAKQYLEDESVRKSELGRVILSENLLAIIPTMKKVILDVRARERAIKAATKKLKDTTFAMYRFILADNCTRVLREYLRDDIEEIRKNRTNFNDTAIRFFTRLFQNKPIPPDQSKMSADDVKAMTVDELVRITDVDLTTIKEQEAKLEANFTKFEYYIDFNSAIWNADENLVNAYQELKEVLTEYKLSGDINTDFLRDNILNVDIFFRELSYEVIQQQKAYELTNLWSDIGGSLGLFVGASVLTVAELIDVVVHTCLRKHAKKTS